MSYMDENLDTRASLNRMKKRRAEARKKRFLKRIKSLILVGIIIVGYKKSNLNIIHSFSNKIKENLFPKEEAKASLAKNYIKNQDEMMTMKEFKEMQNKNDHIESQELIKDTEETNIEEEAESEVEKIEEDQMVDLSYFDDAVFLGNSRTETFILFTGLSNATSYAYKGFSVSKVFEEAIVPINGQKLTVIDALKHTDFSKAYLMFGFNETGWIYPEIFIEKYGAIIDEIRNVNPNASIYVQSIIPVSESYSEKNPAEGNERIAEYNKLIEKMAEEKGVYFLNVKEAVVNSEGILPEEAASDGLHLKKEYAEKWLNYLRANTKD